MDIFRCAPKERCFEDAVRNGDGLVGVRRGLLEVQEGEVDVSLKMRREPGSQGGGSRWGGLVGAEG